MTRVYDLAKTPLQRLVLSGVLPASTQQELTKIAQALDPLSLLQYLQQLQHALFHCTVSVPSAPHSPFTTSLVRFPLERCTSGALPIAKSVEEGSDPASTLSEAPSSTAILDWPRTIRDPFAREWERILAWVHAHPEICGSEIFRELLRLFPGRYHPSQIDTLYHGLRKIRAALREHWEEPWPSEMIQARMPDPIASEPGSSHLARAPPNVLAGRLGSCAVRDRACRFGRGGNALGTGAATPERSHCHRSRGGRAPRRECAPIPLRTGLGWCVASPGLQCC